MNRPIGWIPIGLALATTLLACASTSLVNQWKAPDYAGLGFKRIMVMGVTQQTSTRRIFEDEFVAQIKAAGIDAVQSYTVLPEDGPADEEKLVLAVQTAEADGVISARLVKVEQKMHVTSGHYRPAPYMDFYGWYSTAWMGFYDPPIVYQYDLYTSETSLYAMPENKVVWSGTARTAAPGSDIRKEIAAYARIMIKAMKETGVLGHEGQVSRIPTLLSLTLAHT
jgi:hypothetical protein